MSYRDRPITGVIDYTSGNSQSVVHALNALGVPNRLMTAPHELDSVDRVVLPGVGSAGTTMEYLTTAGWPAALRPRVVDDGMPFLGICVGLQILFESSAEQDATCLGWLPGTVRPFDSKQVRVPQIGWNQVRRVSDHPFLAGLPEDGEGYFYFVNSYYAVPEDPSDTGAVTEYGLPFPAAVARGNIMATQFHCEKSGPLGLDLLSRFAKLPQGELC